MWVWALAAEEGHDLVPFLWAGSAGGRVHMWVRVGKVCCRRGKAVGGEKAREVPGEG